MGATMLFKADKDKILIIAVTLKPNAMGARGWYTLNRYAAAGRSAIGNSGATGSEHYAFTFSPTDIAGWDKATQLEFDVLATFLGATSADFLIDVLQIDPATGAHVPCGNLDAVPAGKPPNYRFTVDTPDMLLPSGTFAVVF